MATKAYQNAPDKDPQVDNQKGTKQAMLTAQWRSTGWWPGGG
jgi:hypothetical protein